MKFLVVKDPQDDSAEYLAEMLRLWGGAHGQVRELSGAPEPARTPVAIVPPGAPLPASWAGAFLAGGGHLILIAPGHRTLEALELPWRPRYAADGGVGYMRLVRPVLGAFSHTGLPIVGRRVRPPSGDGQELGEAVTVWAYAYEIDGKINDRPLIWTAPAAGGLVTVFAYDLVECYRDLRQGRPEHAGWRPDEEDSPRAAHLFGPDWERTFRGGHLPVADFHPMLLLRLAERGLDAPPLRFWQLPGAARSAVLISGDEDGGDPAFNEEMCQFLDTLKAKMVIYIQMSRTRTPPEQLARLMERGHGFSVHPYPSSRTDLTPADGPKFLKELAACVAEFKQRYGLATRSIRNHRMFWTGYTDVARLWGRLGVEMDCNFSHAINARDSNRFFSQPAGCLPMGFLDEGLRRIDVLQQPLHASDDVCFSPEFPYSLHLTAEMFESLADKLLTDTLRPLGAPFAVCFHPVNYHRFAGEPERRFLRRAKARGAALISDYQWLDFWRMRQSWTAAGVDREGERFRYRLAGGRPSAGLAVSFPARRGGRTVRCVGIDGGAVETIELIHFGQERKLLRLPDGASELSVTLAPA